MKSIISKILVAGTIVTTLSLNVLAGPIRPMLADTGKMGKMSKMDKKMDKKKMDKMDKKMSKDTGKMSKMAKKKM
ncbi:MAG: hypothetical protein V4560_15725 [Bacteroidota bacterium]|jgi:uncharacterized membrane protein (DUF106 family)